MHLPESYIHRISRYLDESALVHGEVKADILDHMCCQIEAEMEQGESFDKAFEQSCQVFAPEDLADIQADTLYFLTIKRNRMLLKTIFITAYASVALYVMGFGFLDFFKFFLADQPTAYMLSFILKTAGVSFFCFGFLPALTLYGYRRALRLISS
ncbi:MAG: hypothetical protein AAFR61_04215 [Bacteroidota bacterium]